MPNPNMCHIVVGCGGSGAKTAHTLALLMAQDPRWRYEMDEHVYFLLIDTDRGDLSRYKLAIEAAAPHVFVTALQTSAGFNSPHEVVDQFRGGIDRTAAPDQRRRSMQRFSDHWWTRDPHADSFDAAHVFRVPFVDDITKGAGQVPMVSHIATWQAMRDNQRGNSSVEGTLSGLFQKIADTRSVKPAGDGGPLDNFNIMFIGSVAGGTGRGCAIPLAFKMKEVIFERFNSVPRISGYFMNEDCFDRRREPHESLPQIMNAMTGWSELSAWITHYQREQAGEYGGETGYRYRLPSPTRPDDEAYDVLRPIADIKGCRPFDAVGIIGRTSGAGNAAPGPEEIYEMLAAGLYVRITQSHVDSKNSNDGRNYFSIGSSVVEVPFEDLRRYFEDRARLDAANRISKPLEGATVKEWTSTALTLLGFEHEALDLFLGMQERHEAKSVRQKLARDLISSGGTIDNRIGPLREAMEAQDLEGSREQLEDILSEGQIDDLAREVGRRYLAILGEHLTAQLGREVRGVPAITAVVAATLTDDQDGVLVRTGSAKAVAQVAREIRLALGQLVESHGAFSAEAVAAWHSQKGRSAREALESAKDREGFLGLGGRFSADEKIEVAAAAADELRCLCARALGKALSSGGQEGSGLFAALRARLDSLAAHAEASCAAMVRVLGEAQLSEQALSKAEERLFSGERLEQSLSNATGGDTGYLLRRRICPAMPDKRRLELDNPVLLATVRELLNSQQSPPDPSRVSAQTANALKTALHTVSYYLRDVAGAGRVPVMEAFQLQPVLRDLAGRWQEYLTRLHARDLDRYKKVEQDFRNFFGIHPRIRDREVLVESDDGQRGLLDAGGEDFLMLSLATVAARTCRPFWRTTSDRGQSPRVTVQVPIDIKDTNRAGWVEVVRRAANLHAGDGTVEPVTLIENHALGTGMGFNPYVLVVYASSGASSLEDVLSLGSWNTNPTVQRCLVKAEQVDIPMPFREPDDMWHGYRGSGFTDPVYVYHLQMRNARWRPWAAGEGDARAAIEAQRTRRLRALAYAVVGPEWFLRLKVVGEYRGNTVVGPLLKLDRRHSVVLARRPVVFQKEHRPELQLQLETSPGQRAADIGAEGTAVATTLDELARALDPGHGRGVPPNLRPVHDDLIDEYESFLEQVAGPCGFHPKYGAGQFRKTCDEMRTYAVNQIDRTEHGDHFWKQVAAAFGHPEQG